ncbi:MAG: imidazole glycerol phosphate synthase subunit HisF [Bacteroidales bacterium]
MLAKRIIPCLDVLNGKTVKGIQFLNLTEIGDPATLAHQYSKEGADELVFLDITASHENRNTRFDWVKSVAETINIPFTVGGGINSIETAKQLLRSGADKISINSAAIANPLLIKELSKKFGIQCIVLAVDAKLNNGKWEVYSNGGRKQSKLELFDWCKKAEKLGAGEILFTSMNHDGTKNGYALEALKKLGKEVNIPIIASGGAGKEEDFYDVFHYAKADGALAASVFHYGEIRINSLKNYLDNKKISIRKLS